MEMRSSLTANSLRVGMSPLCLSISHISTLSLSLSVSEASTSLSTGLCTTLGQRNKGMAKARSTVMSSESSTFFWETVTQIGSISCAGEGQPDQPWLSGEKPCGCISNRGTVRETRSLQAPRHQPHRPAAKRSTTGNLSRGSLFHQHPAS